jgi:hypothetical protein
MMREMFCFNNQRHQLAHSMRKSVVSVAEKLADER